MTWLPEAYDYLIQEKYEQVAEIYEELIARESEVISHYWYLAIAYLLQEKEEETQALLLSIFMEADESCLSEFIDILETEAQRLESLSAWKQAWIIRVYLQEIDPENLNNTLKLIKRELDLSFYSPERLAELGIVELIKNSSQESLEDELILEVLFKILELPNKQNLPLVEVVLGGTKFHEMALEKILNFAVKVEYEKQLTEYALDLSQICLKYKPKDLHILKIVGALYSRLNKFDEAKAIADKLLENSQTLEEKIYANYLLLYIKMKIGDWLEVMPMIEQYKLLLKQMYKTSPQKNDNSEDFITIHTLFYLEDSPEQTRRIQNYFSQIFQEKIARINPVKPVNKTLNQKIKHLRIGYIASTLRSHSVGWLSRWLFHYHNREEFYISIYLVEQQEDKFTEKWIIPNADKVYKCPKNAQKIYQKIQEDNIDILIDLDSLTCNLTCQVMALKPAPIQVTWLGLDASGIPAIDYFIADKYVLPENAQDYYQEKIWRLPTTYVAVDGFEIGIPTLKRQDLEIPDTAVIYFNAQNSLKLNPIAIRLQMQILKAVENGYLVVKATADEEAIRNLYTQIAKEENLSLEKLRFLPRFPNEETHRANVLSLADVVLDTYPYNGATTTLEVLWLGIPIVTRVGEQFAARNSYTFMVNAGLTEGIAWTDSEYIDWGIRLGQDESLRQQISQKLKKSRQTAPLWNAKAFTREMEKAYQQMWLNKV